MYAPKLRFIFLLPVLRAHLSVSHRGEVAGEQLAFGNLTDLASSPGSPVFGWETLPRLLMIPPRHVPPRPTLPHASAAEGWRAAEESLHFVLPSSPDREGDQKGEVGKQRLDPASRFFSFWTGSTADCSDV